MQPDPFGLERRRHAPTATSLRLADGGGRFAGLGYGFDLRQAVANNAYFGYEISVEAQTAWFHATRVRRAREAPARLVARAGDRRPARATGSS